MPRGVFRRVILVGRLAVKFPRVRNLFSGMRCNRWEREMWNVWRPVFGWETLCPVLFADPFGILVVMPRAKQPVTASDVDSLPDYYPQITSELKSEDYGRLGNRVFALDYGLWDVEDVTNRRAYYLNKRSDLRDS